MFNLESLGNHLEETATRLRQEKKRLEFQLKYGIYFVFSIFILILAIMLTLLQAIISKTV